MDSGKVFLGFLSGAAAGLVIGMLYAPHKGAVTRRKIVRTAKDISNNVTDKFKDLAERAEEFVEDIKDAACELTQVMEDEQ